MSPLYWFFFAFDAGGVGDLVDGLDHDETPRTSAPMESVRTLGTRSAPAPVPAVTVVFGAPMALDRAMAPRSTLVSAVPTAVSGALFLSPTAGR